ncbi:hypothetical protein ACHWQZ_G000804 [Mnemiopsis leidyi]
MKCTLHLTLLLFLLSLSNTEPIPPPDHTDLVGTARWIVKFSNVSILSTQSSFLDGYPFGQNKDVADGLYSETLSAGVPYIYTSPLEIQAQDVLKNPKVTFGYSSEFTHWCKDNNVDNDDPRCAKVMLSGEMEKVADDTEIKWAQYGMFARHPATKHWPVSHGFAFYKLNIENIFVLDFYGGPTMHLNVTEYMDYKFDW